MDEVKFLRERPRFLNVVNLEGKVWWDAENLVLELVVPGGYSQRWLDRAEINAKNLGWCINGGESFSIAEERRTCDSGCSSASLEVSINATLVFYFIFIFIFLGLP